MTGNGEAHRNGPTRALGHHQGGEIVLTLGHHHHDEEIETEVEDARIHTQLHLHQGKIDIPMSQADESGVLLHIGIAMLATSGEG